MVALKAADVDRFVARPDPGKPIALVFGPDAGLVRERADALVRSAVDDPRDPFALALLEGDILADAPERLVEEAHTVPLFGGRRAILVKAGGRSFVGAVERVLAVPPAGDCRIVIEAGDLKRGAPLRTLCERAAVAAALPCYADTGRDLDRLIDEEMRKAGMAIAPEARSLLASLIGGDRRASRAEIGKLALYAHGRSKVGVEDVMAVVADATIPAVDGIVDAAFAGRADDLEVHFAKARASGVSATAIVGAALRQVAVLHRYRLAVEAGAAIGEVVRAPAVHFSREKLVRAAVESSSAARLERLIGQLGETSLEVRKNGRLAYVIAQRALLSIAVAARRKE
jgi:DNA polymerase III subunit delta